MNRLQMQFVHVLCVVWVRWQDMVLRFVGRLKSITLL